MKQKNKTTSTKKSTPVSPRTTKAKPKGLKQRSADLVHDDHHDGDPTLDGIVPNWRPSVIPLMAPHGHDEDIPNLEQLKQADAFIRGARPLPIPADPKTPGERFTTFCGKVIDLLKRYNSTLDDWRKAESQVDKLTTLKAYRLVAKEFSKLIENTDLVETSEDQEFMLEVHTNAGFVTDVRILAHPKAKGPKLNDKEILYSHSRSYLKVIDNPRRNPNGK